MNRRLKHFRVCTNSSLFFYTKGKDGKDALASLLKYSHDFKQLISKKESENMVITIKRIYLARRTTKFHSYGNQNNKRAITNKNRCYRDWWLVKVSGNGYSGSLGSTTIPFAVSFPKEFIGKKIKFKLIVLEEAMQ